MNASASRPAFPVLIAAAGRRVALLRIFRETLASLGLAGPVYASDMSPLAAAFHDADRGFRVPPSRDPAFIPTLLDLCARHAVRLVIPTNDHELPALAAARERFAAVGTTVAISTPEVIDIARDKGRTHAWLTAHGFPTVRQATPAEVLANPADFPFPLIVKPRAGSASLGVRVVADAAALAVATRDGDFLVQTLARGSEHTVDVFVDRHGRCLAAVPRRRLEVRSGEVSKAVTVRAPRLQDLARRVAETLPGAYATLNIQLFYDAERDDVRIIEINPRFGGGYPLSWRAGADFPRWLIADARGEPAPATSDAFTDGLVMLRYDDAVFVSATAAGL